MGTFGWHPAWCRAWPAGRSRVLGIIPAAPAERGVFRPCGPKKARAVRVGLTGDSFIFRALRAGKRKAMCLRHMRCLRALRRRFFDLNGQKWPFWSFWGPKWLPAAETRFRQKGQGASQINSGPLVWPGPFFSGHSGGNVPSAGAFYFSR